MISRLGFVVGALLVLGAAVPVGSAGASPAPRARVVHAVETSSGPLRFNPQVSSGVVGDTWSWSDTSGVGHTSTQNGPLSVWTVGIPANGTAANVYMDWSGSYPYHCSIHPSMTGRVRLKPSVSPANSGAPGDTFQIVVATQKMLFGQRFNVQRRVNGKWKFFKNTVDQDDPDVSFKPSSPGTYKFRSRLQDTGLAVTSGWSPPVVVTVA